MGADDNLGSDYSAHPIIEDSDFIERVLLDPGAFDIFCSPKTENQERIVKRTIHWLSFGGILGRSRITIRFREKTTKGGYCKCKKGATDWFEFMFSSIFVEDEVDRMIGETCPHEVAHAIVHMSFPNGGVKPHGDEWKAEMWKMLGRKPLTTHDMDTIKILREKGGGYAFCDCDQGRGKIAVNSDILDKLNQGETLICPRCKTPLFPESDALNLTVLWKEEGTKALVRDAIEEASIEMARASELVQSAGERVNDEDEVEDIILFCNCKPPNNFRMLSDLPSSQDTIVCDRCRSIFSPKSDLGIE